jgi:hypothetical protein
MPADIKAFSAAAACRGERQTKEKLAMKSRHSALRLFLVLTVVFALSAASPLLASSIWYVRWNAVPPGNGTSWATAFPTVEQALAAASPTRDAQGQSDQCWVMQGQYRPPIVGLPPNATSNGYIINKPLRLFGAFKGTETSVQGRLGSYLKTILDGDINGTPYVANDNALHIVSITDVLGAPGVVIDGFLIRGGYATGAGVNGAGILSTRTSLDLAHCFFRSNYASSAIPGAPNYGGGLYFTSATGVVYPVPAYTLNIKDSEFTDDKGNQGGAIYGDGVTGAIVNTKFIDSRSLGNGAGVCLTKMGSGDLLHLTNCVFLNNFATGQDALGGGLHLGTGGGDAGNAQLVNCTFAGNQCAISSATGTYQDGQAMGISSGSQATIYNSIFFSNNSTDGAGGFFAPIVGSATIDWSDIEGGWSPMANNKDLDPKFVNLPGGNLTLQLSPPSPCLDAADYGRLPLDTLDLDGDGNTNEIIPWDIAWQARWVDQFTVGDSGTGTYTFLDMGAYELP